jgi:hypothetical protein
MKAAELIEQCPRLFHLSEAGAWPSIAAHGLLTAAQIVSTSGLSAEEQARILARPRPGRLAVSHPCLGTVFLRD